MNSENTKTQVEVVPVTPSVSVHVILSDDSGPRALYGGVCPLLAQALRQASQSVGSGVTLREDVWDALGQDIYDVTFTAVMRLRGLFSFLSYRVIDQLHTSWPETFRYSFVVTR